MAVAAPAPVPAPAPALAPAPAPGVEEESLESFLALDFPILDQLFQSVQVRQGFPSGPRTMPGGRGVLASVVDVEDVEV